MITSKGMLIFIVIMVLCAMLGAWQNKNMKIESESIGTENLTINLD